jgi:hypothetical protein
MVLGDAPNIKYPLLKISTHTHIFTHTTYITYQIPKNLFFSSGGVCVRSIITTDRDSVNKAVQSLIVYSQTLTNRTIGLKIRVSAVQGSY